MADKGGVPRVHDQIQSAAEVYYSDAMRQVKEFKERWQNIYAREDARWYQAGKEWKLATEQDGHLSWKPYPKTVDATVQDFKAAQAGMTEDRAARDRAREGGYGR